VFAGEDVRVNPRSDWPLGAALRKRRIARGLSVKAASRRTDGQVSDGRWYQLESGVQKIRGQEIPIGTTPSTVAAAARAVDWNVSEALKVAGFDEREATAETVLSVDTPSLRAITDEQLIAELRERLLERKRPIGSRNLSRDSQAGERRASR
jgi:hypothetical protein